MAGMEGMEGASGASGASKVAGDDAGCVGLDGGEGEEDGARWGFACWGGGRGETGDGPKLGCERLL